jgi:hypothetical protein
MGLHPNIIQEVTTMFLSFKQRFYRFLKRIAMGALVALVVFALMLAIVVLS